MRYLTETPVDYFARFIKKIVSLPFSPHIITRIAEVRTINLSRWWADGHIEGVQSKGEMSYSYYSLQKVILIQALKDAGWVAKAVKDANQLLALKEKAVGGDHIFLSWITSKRKKGDSVPVYLQKWSIFDNYCLSILIERICFTKMYVFNFTSLPVRSVMHLENHLFFEELAQELKFPLGSKQYNFWMFLTTYLYAQAKPGKRNLDLKEIFPEFSEIISEIQKQVAELRKTWEEISEPIQSVEPEIMLSPDSAPAAIEINQNAIKDIIQWIFNEKTIRPKVYTAEQIAQKCHKSTNQIWPALQELVQEKILLLTSGYYRPHPNYWRNA